MAFDIDNCFAIYEDREGYLWFGGVNGLFRYDGKKTKKMQMTTDLDKKSVCAIAQDSQGHLWLGTDGGVVHYNGQLFQTIKSPHIGPVLQILEDRDGSFWFGTVQNTLVRFRSGQ